MIHLVTLNPALDLYLQIEKSKTGKVGKLEDFSMEAGGKALNVIRFLRKMKIPAVVWLGTGGGEHSTHRLYRYLLAKEKLKVRFLSNKTPVRFNAVISQKNSVSKFNHSGFETHYTGFSRLMKAVKRGDSVVLTGRLPKDGNDSLYASWIDLFQRKGAKVILDTSGKPLQLGLRAKPWFFKVNRFELSESLSNRMKNLREVLFFVKANWTKMNFAQGAITDGAHGALVWSYPECFWLSSRTKNKNFVVGAGDAFLAGYLYGKAKKMNLKNSALWAAAFGAMVAESGIHGFTAERTKKLFKQMRAKRVL